MARINDNAGAYVALIAVLLAAGGAHAASPAAKCEAAKLKIAGKYGLCRVTAQAKGVKIGPGAETSGDFAKCDATFAKKWAAAEKKGGTSCPTSGDAGRVQLLVDQLALTAGFTLAGVRFLDNGDGTITDTQTGLMWEKKDGSDGAQDYNDPHDVDNLYMWSRTDVLPDGTAFTEFLGQLNNCFTFDGIMVNGGLAGHCDWRLPTFKELTSLYDSSQPGCGGTVVPCIAPIFLPVGIDPTFMVSSRRYWTSLTAMPTAAEAFGFDGSSSESPKSQGDFVRAVRGGS